jgi:hypothetical protein
MAFAEGLTGRLRFCEAFVTNGEAAETIARPGFRAIGATQQNRVPCEIRAIVDSP